VRTSLPIPGVSFILGNDLARGDVWGKPVAPPQVVSVLLSSDADECTQTFPDVFPSCAVTHAMSQQIKSKSSTAEFDNLDTFFAKHCGRPSAGDIYSHLGRKPK